MKQTDKKSRDDQEALSVSVGGFCDLQTEAISLFDAKLM